jgi:hypothetical protein
MQALFVHSIKYEIKKAGALKPPLPFKYATEIIISAEQ